MNTLITTVTLNAAIDKTYWIPGFAAGAVNRTARMNATPGGKGLNVARVVQQLEQAVVATGFAGGFNGRQILSRLDQLGLRHDFIAVDGESRICLNILDDRDGALRSTEILEQGPTIGEADIERIERTLERLAGQSRIVAFSGSLPAGAPTDLYARLIGICTRQGALAYLDTSGQALQQGVLARPAFMKPNEHEIGALIGVDAPSEADIGAGIRALMAQGVRTVVVTMGGQGSVAGHEGRLYRVIPPAVQAVNTVGCGDAFVGGMSAAEVRGLAIEERLAYATAVASASAMTDETGALRRADVDSLLPQVAVKPL